MKVLFVDSVHPILAETLAEKGVECVEDYKSSKEEIERKLKGINGIVIRSRFPIDKTFLDAANDLKFIARSGSGLENIDLDYAAKKGVKVFSSPEGNRDAVAEHALGMLLMLFNHLGRANEEVRKGIWDREGNRGIELCGKTVGIIGYGVMGKAFAQRLRGFECEILAYDKYKSGFGDKWVQEVDLPTLQQEADIISFHVPLATDTRYYFNADFTENLAKPIYLINTSRGNVVNTAHLAECLENGLVRGACLDVLEYEKKSFEKLRISEMPQPFQKLLASEKVILSPHVAGWTVESYEKLSRFLADKICGEFGL